MTQPELAFENLGALDLAFRRWPEPNGAAHPPVVLLHGVLQTGEGMRHLAERLALDGEVIVPDLRGRGASGQPADGYDPATMASDVSELLTRLAIGNAVIIGRLHGGVIAYHLAASNPGQVLGLVLGDATPEVSAERAERIRGRVAALPAEFASREEAERFYEDILRLSPARTRHDLPSDLERTADGRYRWRHNLDVVARIEAAAMPRSDWDIVRQVKCPTLVLRGQRGEIGPETAARMVQTIRDARAQTIHGGGHDVFLGPGSEQTLAAIQLFLRGLAGRD